MKPRFSLLLAIVAIAVLLPSVAHAYFDHDGDGDIDLDDFEGFFVCLAGPEVEASPACAAIHDGDGDLDVDLFDFGLLQEAFTASSSAITATQLAGNSLDEYPFFEYVKAFNEDATVELGIDPTLFPLIVGHTADVYFVEAKSTGAWATDPTLVDMTPDGAETVTFSGSTIQENTFALTGPYDLDSAMFVDATGNYTGLGHGYDLVIDMNQNGELDGDDYIDGLSHEAGLYVVHDTTQPGPLDVTEVASYSVGTIFGIPAARTNEVLYYPTDIATMEPLPLVVIGHGSGHDYTWYGHIGYHMASYGYIVVSHQNPTGPPDATLGHTDAILHLQGEIAGGALDGKIDSSRIIWIGHSRGGEGVTRAFDALVEGTFTPTHYTTDSIVLISAMLPIVNEDVDMYDVNFHLWTAAGDSDVSGFATMDYIQTFQLHDRAEKYRMSTVVQGAGHGWFHDGTGGPYFEGPCSIGEENTHLIQLGLFLPLMKYYAEGNIPATDFFWRQYERFHPIGVDTSDPCIVVTNEYRNGADAGNFFIDDYQTEESLNVSSSGGAVGFTVENVTEGRLEDNNHSFVWDPSDPFNGATQASSSDTTRGVVFDWDGFDAYYEWGIIPAQQDFSDDLYLSFRSAQGTQHPYTLAVLDDLTFTVTLRDSVGTSSSINIGVYGGGLEQPYQRYGGWHNEMEVIRIRPSDFLANGSGLDLTNIAAVRFNFGPSWGSNEGRIVVDELMLTNDYTPYFTPLTMIIPAAPPEFIQPGATTDIDVEIFEGDDAIVDGTAQLHYRYDGGVWRSIELVRIAGELWLGTLPAADCGDTPEYYFSVTGAETGVVYAPGGGASTPYVSFVGSFISILDDDFETDQDWTVEDDPSLTAGSWERGVPADDGTDGDPISDYDGTGQCYLTGNYPGNSDVDGGPTYLISPTIDLSDAGNPVLRYARWWANDDQDDDSMDVEISNDDGVTWYPVETVMNIPPSWVPRSVYIANYVTPLTNQMKIRFSVMDNPNNSRDEGGIDALEIFEVRCD